MTFADIVLIIFLLADIFLNILVWNLKVHEQRVDDGLAETLARMEEQYLIVSRQYASFLSYAEHGSIADWEINQGEVKQ